MARPLPAPPEAVGPYRVLSPLAKGGMGLVYRAEAPGTGAAVAVKIVRVPKEVHLLGIRHEIRTLRQLQHPGVVRILDQGEKDGKPWYAMELLAGQTGEDYCQALFGPQGDTNGKNRPPAAAGRLQEVLNLAYRLCEPLAFLHREGVVHGDLKPANVMIRSGEGVAGTVVLIDFGLAARFAGSLGREHIDALGSLGGTLHYMAPEQLRGQLVDARTDLYAVGCILYRLLTGRAPFIGAAQEVMAAHLSEPPLPPSEIVAAVPATLEELVLSLLAKNPRDRPGYAEDVMALLAGLGAVAEGAETPQRFAYLYRPALRGRDQVLADLGASLRGLEKGRGGCVLVHGESGIGKTYLALELGRQAVARGIRSVAGSCISLGPNPRGPGRPPLYPFLALSEHIADYCQEQGPACTERILSTRGPVLSGLFPALGRLPGQEALQPPPELPFEGNRERLLVALRDTLVAFAKERPLLLLLDDLQWADELTMHFLCRVSGPIFADAPLLLLGTYRSEELSAELEELARRPEVQTLQLRRLEEADLGHLVSDMLAMTGPPAAFVRFLSRSSAGNPFFVAEYLRMAVAEGLLLRRPLSPWQLRGQHTLSGLQESDFEALPVPQVLEEVLERRLSLLDPASRALAEALSVLGPDADEDLLQAMAAESRDGEQGGLRIDPAATRELEVRQVLDTLPTGGIRFIHERLRTAAYERIPKARRKALHRAAALSIEARMAAPRTKGPQLATLSHHFLQAELADRAFVYLERAGQQALDAGSHGEAADLCQRALVLDDTHGQALSRGGLGRARLTRLQAEAKFAVGNIAETIEALSLSLRLLGHRIPRRRGGWVLYLLLQLLTQLWHVLVPRRRSPSQQQEEVLVEGATASLRLLFAATVGSETIHTMAAALLAANLKDRTGPQVPKGTEYATLGIISGFVGLRGLSARYFAMAEESVQRTGHNVDHILTRQARAILLQGNACWEESNRVADEGIAACEAMGDHFFLLGLLNLKANNLALLGEPGQALAIAQAAAALAERNGYGTALHWGQISLAQTLIRLGGFEEARAILTETRAGAEGRDDFVHRGLADGLLALVHLELGDLEAACACADRTQLLYDKAAGNLVTFAVQHTVPTVYLRCWERALADGLPSAEAGEKARRACQAAWAYGRLYPCGRPAALRHRGMLLALRGRGRRAAQVLAESVAQAQRLHMPYEEAQARYELGHRLDPGSGAREAHLYRARELFARMGNLYYAGLVEKLRTGG